MPDPAVLPVPRSIPALPRCLGRSVGRVGVSPNHLQRCSSDYYHLMRLLAGAPQELAAASNQNDRQCEWSFVRAGEWLSDILADLRRPENLKIAMLLRQPWLLDVRWRLVVLDEAQAIKNPAARQTKAVKRLQASARMSLPSQAVRFARAWRTTIELFCRGPETMWQWF